jgi:hypothetical protein
MLSRTPDCLLGLILKSLGSLGRVLEAGAVDLPALDSDANKSLAIGRKTVLTEHTTRPVPSASGPSPRTFLRRLPIFFSAAR